MLYGMLDPNTPSVASLNWTRVPSFNAATVKQAFGPMVTIGHNPLPSTDPKVVSQLIEVQESTERSRTQKSISMHCFDNTWIAQEKESHAADAAAAGSPILSTNDVLASWLFKHSGVTHGNIVCDCRGRIPGLPAPEMEFKPGTYISAIFCEEANFDSPLAVRRKVTDTMQRASSASDAPISAPPALGNNFRLGNLTNWTRAYQHVNMPGCQHVVHFPICNSAQDVFYSNLYLFRPRAGEIAAMLFQTENGDEQPLAGGPLVTWTANPSHVCVRMHGRYAV